MKVGYRSACLSAAVIATLYGSSAVLADVYQWDRQGTGAPAGSDGGGDWDLTSNFWVNLTNPSTPPAAVPFVNGNSAVFGTTFGATGTAVNYDIILNANITVQNLTLGTAANGAGYSLYDQGDGGQTLTLTGNFTKGGRVASPQILLTNAIQLTAGNHIFGAGDSPGDAKPEAIFDSALTGDGSITIDNSNNYSGVANDIQYGTIAFNTNNTYTGGTTVQLGRLLANTAGALGSGAVTIQGGGALAFGGGGTSASDMTVNNTITITRSDYTTNITNNRYGYALAAGNDGSSNTFTVPNLVVASTDARVAALTNKLVLPNSITTSTIDPATAVLTLDGDFAGFTTLGGDNTGFGTAGGTIKIQGGVEVDASSEANLGGPNSKLHLAGGFLRPTGTLGAVGSPFMTNFGGHTLVGGTAGTGLTLVAGQVFNVNGLTGGGVGTRGTGTINFDGTNTFTGTPFFDGGIANFNAGSTTTQQALRLRNATANVAGTLNVSGSFSSIGVNSGENATVNITGNGAVLQATGGNDFNISDNANTQGTINISGNGSLVTSGRTYLGKSLNATGTINQTGGSIKTNRNGDFTFVLGRDNGTGIYNFSGGTFDSVGEVFVGQGFGNGVSGSGTWNQSGGTATINNWFVIGREGGKGTVDLSGGTIIKKGGGNTPIGEGGNGTRSNVFTIRGTGTFDAQTGEVWVSNGNNTTTMNIQDQGTLNVNNYFVVGRFGNSKGFLNMSGGTINKGGAVNQVFVVAPGGGSQGTVNQTGGTINNTTTDTAISEGGLAVYNFSGGTLNAGLLDIGRNGGSSGTLNMSGTAALNAGTIRVGQANTVVGTLNFNGGTITADQLIGGGSTGAKTVNFNGGKLVAKSDNTNFLGGLTTANVQAGGVLIDTNTRSVTASQALVHDSALATADGGLTKSGAGMLTLTGANTYTGATVVQAGTLRATTPAYSTAILGAGGSLDLQGTSIAQFDYTGSSSPVGQVQSILTAGYPNFSSGQIKSTVHAANATLGYGDNGSVVTVRVTLGGDSDLDGDVDFNDFLALQNSFNQPDTRFDQGNYNYDGTTNFNDFLILQNNFGQTVAGVEAPAISAAQFAQVMAITSSNAVPEPTTLGLIGLGAAGLMSRRRRPVSAA